MVPSFSLVTLEMNCLETHPVIQITWSADFGVGDCDSAWCHVVCQDPGRADTPVVYAGGCRESSREFHLWALWVSRNWSISIFGCLMCTDLSMDSNSKDVLVLTSYWHTEHSFCGGGLSIPTCVRKWRTQPCISCLFWKFSELRQAMLSLKYIHDKHILHRVRARKLLPAPWAEVFSCNYWTIWQKKHIEVMTKAARLTTAHCSNWLKVLSIVILAFLLCHPNITQTFEGSHGTRGIFMEFKCWSNGGILFAMHLKKLHSLLHWRGRIWNQPISSWQRLGAAAKSMPIGLHLPHPFAKSGLAGLCHHLADLVFVWAMNRFGQPWSPWSPCLFQWWDMVRYPIIFCKFHC